MTVLEHYECHLSKFYSWMLGDFIALKNVQKDFFSLHGIRPVHSKMAIDLGAGNGIQTVALAELGYSVKSIDFSTQLLTELMQHANGLEVEAVESFILHYLETVSFSPGLIACMGDTITHLQDEEAVTKLILQSNLLLVKGGEPVIPSGIYPWNWRTPVDLFL